MEIETSARLHLSLIDLNGLEGRIDGGIGITLKNPSLVMDCKPNDSKTQIIFDKSIAFNNLKEYESKILFASNKMQEYLDVAGNYTFEIKRMYPIHYGLGLGTQLLLSTGQLIAKLNDVDLDVFSLAKIVQRGGTSGIGVHSFNKGGLIIDGGHKKDMKQDFLPSSASRIVSPPPLLARYDFPEDWNIILATPNINQGASGNFEVDIFQKYSPIDIKDVERICYLTLMKLMPAVVEGDLLSFGDAVNKIQGLGFKNVERNLQSNIIEKLIEYMRDNEIPATGMSSFGPTCFGITDNNVKSIKRDLEDFMGEGSNVILTKGKNEGSKITKR